MKRKSKMADRPFGSLPQTFHQQIIDDFKSMMVNRDSSSSYEPNTWVRTVSEFNSNYLISEFLSKLGTEAIPADERRQLAINKWLTVDDLNARSNQRLCWSSSQLRLKNGTVVTTDEALDRAAKIIVRTIGSEPPHDILSRGLFSNGASTRITRSPDSIARKYVGKADVTADCWSAFLPEMLNNRLWSTLNDDAFRPNFVDGNVMFTVPKNSTIDRVACKEPEINMLAQKAVGDHLRSRLLRFGIDLNDQTRNQNLAFVGSKYRDLATIDLSSASDSISSMLVSRLLPPGWFVLLNALRSKVTLIDSKQYTPNMFSSMGNGFTFELESLIFYSLSRVACYYTGSSGTISVYGDDIIVPVSAAKFLTTLLNFCGFKVNPKKTHSDPKDPFRESCGKHFYDGVDVTPFYVREPINHVTRLIHFLNHIVIWADSEADEQLASFWRRWAQYVPRSLWGGNDPLSINSLYSFGNPRKKIVMATRKFIVNDIGGYLQWLHMRDGRRGETLDEFGFRQPTITSSVLTPRPRWVLRQNRDRHERAYETLLYLIDQT